jgi:hypothetical protein
MQVPERLQVSLVPQSLGALQAVEPFGTLPGALKHAPVAPSHRYPYGQSMSRKQPESAES